MIAHVVLAGQNGMLFDPDDRLAEVQAARLQRCWVVADVRIAAPDVEAPAWQQHARQIAEPGVQEIIEVRFREEIVGHRSVFGPKLLVGRFGLLRMPAQIAAGVEPIILRK